MDFDPAAVARFAAHPLNRKPGLPDPALIVGLAGGAALTFLPVPFWFGCLLCAAVGATAGTISYWMDERKLRRQRERNRAIEKARYEAIYQAAGFIPYTTPKAGDRG